MLNLELRRFLRSSDRTVGALLRGSSVLSMTLELPFLDNQSSVSCIPCGEFVATRVKSPKFGDTFDIAVPGRSFIRFHSGNVAADSRGCILLCDSVIGDRGFGSRRAVSRFLDELDGVQQFRLVVQSAG